MRALLRRQLTRPLQRPFLRYQHDLPHKEYFQNPGQTPLPDQTPYTPPPPPAFPAPRSYFRRGLQSISWATLFCTLGFGSGVSLLTWDYLQPPFEPGSEEDEEMLEEIETLMDTHPLVQGLREGGWEEKAYKPAQTRLLQTLSGTQGLTLRGFRRPGYTILVFYTGSGIEGWPDIIHGGLITTLFNEAGILQLSGPDHESFPPPHQVVIDFKESIRPGEIYAILVPPSAPTEPTTENATMTTLRVDCILTQMEMAPEITTEVDEVAKTRTDIVSIVSRHADTRVFAQATFYVTVSLESLEEDAQVETVEGSEDGSG